MDFAQGIDSDIEEVATIASAPPGNVEIASTDSNDSQVAVVLPAASELDNNDNEIETEHIDSSPPPPLPQSPPLQSSPPPQHFSPPPPLPPTPPQHQQRPQDLDLELEMELNLELQLGDEDEQEEEAEEQIEQQEREPEPDPEQEQESASASDEPLPATPIPSPPPTPPASPPPLYVAPLERISSTIPTMPTMLQSNTLATSANGIASLTDTSTTDEEDISQIQPMPILPPLKSDLLQMLPTNDRLVLGDDER